jgi:hypothetical protein
MNQVTPLYGMFKADEKHNYSSHQEIRNFMELIILLLFPQREILEPSLAR